MAAIPRSLAGVIMVPYAGRLARVLRFMAGAALAGADFLQHPDTGESPPAADAAEEGTRAGRPGYANAIERLFRFDAETR